MIPIVTASTRFPACHFGVLYHTESEHHRRSISPHRTSSTIKTWLQHHLSVSTFPPLNLQRMLSRTSEPTKTEISGSTKIWMGGNWLPSCTDGVGRVPLFLLFTLPAPKRWSVWPHRSLIRYQVPISVHKHVLHLACHSLVPSAPPLALSKTDDECLSQIDKNERITKAQRPLCFENHAQMCLHVSKALATLVGGNTSFHIAPSHIVFCHCRLCRLFQIFSLSLHRPNQTGPHARFDRNITAFLRAATWALMLQVAPLITFLPKPSRQHSGQRFGPHPQHPLPSSSQTCWQPSK